MSRERAKLIVRGAVQGVGFRPCVYRLATTLNLEGWVSNSAQGVFIEVEGTHEKLENFLLQLEKGKPPRAVIQSLETSFLDSVGYKGFVIRPSDEGGNKTIAMLPDIATCADCRREIFAPNNRRYLYPFTNCTNCGPRFSIIESLPYDRLNTSMKKFTLCAACQKEYDDPHDRRFHAQPNACPSCGPHLELWDDRGNVLAKSHEALLQAAKIIRAGKILALKGIGGFQLLVDSRNEETIMRLRKRKHREEKPLALMYPSLKSIRADCRVSALAERLLLSPESPIVLLERQKVTHGERSRTIALAPSVALNNPYLGVMLPYSPLHHLLLRELEFSIVATSGNLSDEPICIDEHEALERLGGIADAFLVHDRPIIRHVDDSVARVMLGREQVLRRARGYAPLPIHLPEKLPKILAVGAHLKNTVALSVENDIFISQHIGDLETKEAHSAFQKVIADFQNLYETGPECVACDLHPDYLSTKYAQELGTPIVSVQHHFAHVLSCMAENELQPPVLGVSWDGTGYGLDDTIWGGEFLLVNEKFFDRVAHFRPFKLPGGEAAIKQPRRSALGVLYEVFGEGVFEQKDLIPVQNFSPSELVLLQQMLEKDLNSPITTSAGRLFDAVAAISGLRQQVNFEGQAAMELEFAIKPATNEAYPFEVQQNAESIVNWQPMILAIIKDVQRGQALGMISTKFHNALAEIIVALARRIGEQKIVLTGGCFQNKYLTERTVRRLIDEGFRPYWHQRLPPNDGGIALGQVMAAVRVRSTN